MEPREKKTAGKATGERVTAVARAQFQALEVDGVVQITDAAGLRPGDFVDVRITNAIDQDLVGVVAK